MILDSVLSVMLSRYFSSHFAFGSLFWSKFRDLVSCAACSSETVAVVNCFGIFVPNFVWLYIFAIVVKWL